MNTKGEKQMEKVTHSTFRTLYRLPEGVEARVPYSFLGSPYGSEEIEAVTRVIKGGWLTTGIETVQFERDWEAYHNVKYAYTTSSCTTALHMAAQLCRIKPGDEVITTPITFVSTNQAVLAQKGVPVFVDVDPRTFNIDPTKIESAITDKTVALFVTHLAGQMCDMDPIMDIARRNNLLVVEDCAHTAGATYKGKFAGSIGDLGTFSFHAIKNMSTLGEGGMLTTNRDDYAVKIPWLRSMGSRYPNDPHEDGTPGPRAYDVDNVDDLVPNNSRMTESQAAVGQVQLKKLEGFITRRRQIAEAYSSALGGLSGVTVPYESPDSRHTYHLYCLLIEPRNGVTNHTLSNQLLQDYGIQTVPGMYRPSYLFSLYKNYPRKYSCPIAEYSASNALQLPLYPQMTDLDVDYVIESVKALLK
jgi:dTDP-4-amino-4,6-dideoxygalactose transaminase